MSIIIMSFIQLNLFKVITDYKIYALLISIEKCMREQ